METKRRNFIKFLGLGSGAFFFSASPGFSRMQPEDLQEVNKDVFKKVSYETDFLIAGGGMSGVCAAIAAARNGAKVILIQNRSRLGGNASSEIRMHISGASALRQVWRETGILEELVLTEAAENPQRSYEMWDFVLYDKVVSEKNITLLLDTAFIDVQVENGSVKSISAICSPTEEIYDIKAKYFADCTGDATLAAKAGCEYMWGREEKSRWNESLAVDVADNKTMGNSLLFMSQKHEKGMPYSPPKWARKYTTKDFVHRKITQWEYGYWWLELGGMEDTVKEGQQNRHDLLSVLFGVWDYIKNSGNHPESENWALSWVGMIPGKRESRRVVGDFIMKQEDIQSPKMFQDRVAYGGWPLDDHPPGGMNTTGVVPYISIPLKGPYSIPFKSLYAKSMDNLFLAGRNVSVSHVALSSTRVMATCATMGQAIGTAMAYCNQHNLSIRQLANGQQQMQKFQQLLLRQDQSILGVGNQDENDLARNAKITASTEIADGLASYITDGINRDIGNGKSHQWRADFKNGEPWITLKWNSPVQMNKVQFLFDTGLHRFLRISPQDTVYFGQERGPQPETVADYTLEVGRDGKYYPLQKMENNFLRLVTHEFEPITTDTIRIKIHKTNGDELARIFEIRCYLE